jgi:hypothetical protein
MRKRTIDLVLSIVASAVALLLSWPYFRSYEFWPESPGMWWFYFAFGYAIAVYVFYVFLGALHTLFEHDALEHAEAVKQNNKTAGGQS